MKKVGKDAYIDDKKLYHQIPLKSRWLVNKYDIALIQGIDCGIDISQLKDNQRYIVRPIINIDGMSRGASVHWGWQLKDVSELPPGYFYSQFLSGDIYSIDFNYNKTLSVWKGIRSSDQVTFEKWIKQSSFSISLNSDILSRLNSFKYSNLETIGNIVIETHPLRLNPNIRGKRSKYSELIVVKTKKDLRKSKGHCFISDKTYGRLGFLAK